MKLKDGRITFLVGQERTTIEVIDNISSTTFCKIELTPEELSSALSRLAYTKCKCEVRGLDRIGKKHENEEFVFSIDKALASSKNSDELYVIAQSRLDSEGEGWIAEKYFNSQDSFPIIKGRQFAKCIIRRWI